MKKILALLLGLWAISAQAQPVIGPPNQVMCNGIATFSAGINSITQVLALSAGKSIFICGWHVTNTGASGTFAFSSGTGSNCGTGTATVIPAQNVTSNAPSSDHIDYAQLQLPIGTALCVTPSVVTIAGVVWVGQY